MSHSSRSRRPKKKLVIFDFDGVLADSFETFYPFMADMFGKINIPLSRKDYRELFNENVHLGFKKLIGNEDKYELFQKLRKANYDRYYKKNKPKLFSGVKGVLKQLDKNYILAIASSGKRSNIIGLLKKNNIQKHFSLVLATDEHSKENMIRIILEKYCADPKETIMITDTAGDIKIAKKLGLKTIAVGWGFHGPKILKGSKPFKFVGDIKKLTKL